MSRRKVRIPSDERLDQMLFAQLSSICEKLEISISSRATCNSLRIKIKKERKSRNKKNKTTQRNEIRSKIPNKKQRSKSKTQKKAKNTKKKANKKPQVINTKGPPSKPYHCNVDFQKRNVITDDFVCSIVGEQSVVELGYRNKIHLAVITDKQVTAPAKKNNYIVVGDLGLRWCDEDCIEDDNEDGVCGARFDVLINQKPRGFDFLRYVDGSNEQIEYELLRAKQATQGHNQRVEKNQKGTPLDPSCRATVVEAASFIDAIFEVSGGKLNAAHYKKLNEAKNELNKMLFDGRFYRGEYQKIVKGLRTLTEKYNIDINLDKSNSKNKNVTRDYFDTDDDDDAMKGDFDLDSFVKEKSNVKNVNNTIFDEDDQCNDEQQPEVNVKNKSKNKTKIKKPYKCRFCIKSYDAGAKLNDHTEQRHKDENEVKHCTFEECDRVCQDDERLTQHIKRRHNKSEKINVKHAGCKKNGDLTKNKIYAGSTVWRRWGMKKKTKNNWAHCVRCTGCGILWKWIATWDYLKGNPTGISKGNKKNSQS